jgi:hypothetical protein
MSGPPYPPIVSASTTPSINVWTTVISQYANSPILTTLITNLFVYIDQTANFDAFYSFIFNVNTAQGYGLDVYGRIVGVTRVLQVAVSDWFGFAEALPGSDPYGQGGFFVGTAVTSNYLLSDSAFRLLIMAKAAANITNGSIASINQILLSLFPGRGNAYVQDGAIVAGWFGFAEQGNTQGFGQQSFYAGSSLPTMVLTYVFQFHLSPVELAIVGQSGVLPKPAGVMASISSL